MAERILVIKLAGVGDLLTATPALRSLRRSFPQAHIAVLVSPGTAAVLERSPLVDELVLWHGFRDLSVEAALRAGSIAEAWRLLRRLRGSRYDAVLVLHHLTTRPGALKYALLALATGAPVRVGLDNGRGWFLSNRVRDEGFGARHEVDYCLAVAQAAGAQAESGPLELTLSEQAVAQADRWLRPLPLGPIFAVHPGTGSYSPARRWSVGNFAAVADQLTERYHAQVVLLGGPEEKGLAEEVATAVSHRPLNLAGATTLQEAAAVLARCCLLVSNDSGLMHVATAVGTPVVAIFGPSNHRAWGPYPLTSGRNRVVRVDLPCSPCLYRGHQVGRRYGCRERECLLRVTPAMAMVAVGEVLPLAVGQPAVADGR